MTPAYSTLDQPERHDEETPILPVNGTSCKAGEEVLHPPKRHWLVQQIDTPAAAGKALSCLDGLACDDRTRSTVLINFSCIMERVGALEHRPLVTLGNVFQQFVDHLQVDEQLLPSLYR